MVFNPFGIAGVVRSTDACAPFAEVLMHGKGWKVQMLPVQPGLPAVAPKADLTLAAYRPAAPGSPYGCTLVGTALALRTRNFGGSEAAPPGALEQELSRRQLGLPGTLANRWI